MYRRLWGFIFSSDTLIGFFPSERCICLLLLRDGYGFYFRLWNVLFRGFEYRRHFDFLLWKLFCCGFILPLLLKKATQQTNKTQKKSLKVSVSIFLKNPHKMKVREIKLIFRTGIERILLYRLAFERGFLCVQCFSVICFKYYFIHILNPLYSIVIITCSCSL